MDETSDMDIATMFTATMGLAVLLLIGRLARAYIAPLRWILLPASVVAGTIGLLLGPEVGGRLLDSGLLPEDIPAAWREAPGLLISVVFATLFLGQKVPGLRTIWRLAAPQVTLGQTVAWGQYVIGLIVTLLILTPVFGISPLAGALIEIGFEGGHGTAAGLSSTFEELGFAEGRELALGLATIGAVMAVILGSILIKREQRRQDSGSDASPDDASEGGSSGIEDDEDASDETTAVKNSADERSVIEFLSLQLGCIGLAMGIGWLIQQGLVLIEDVTWGGSDGVEVLQHIPLFPLAMVGGVILQLVVDRLGIGRYVSAEMMGRLGGMALDLTIAAAIATLPLEVLAEHWQVLFILAGVGLIWNVVAMLILAPRIIHRDPFPRGISDFGQATGMTATGLMLMRMADPTNRSRAIESFGYKQLLFEPFLGGGIVTAMSLPLIHALGAGPVLAIASAMLMGWLAFAWFGFMRHAGNHDTD